MGKAVKTQWFYINEITISKVKSFWINLATCQKNLNFVLGKRKTLDQKNKELQHRKNPVWKSTNMLESVCQDKNKFTQNKNKFTCKKM